MPVKTDDEGLNAYAQEIVDALEAADVRVELMTVQKNLAIVCVKVR